MEQSEDNQHSNKQSTEITSQIEIMKLTINDESKNQPKEGSTLSDKQIKMRSILFDGVSEEAMAIRNKLGNFEYPKISLSHLEWRDINIYEDGKKYLGTWNPNTNQREGVGIWTKKDGFIYEGLWKNDKPNGKGRLIYMDGDYYVGDFKDARINGKGIYKIFNKQFNFDWLKIKEYLISPL